MGDPGAHALTKWWRGYYAGMLSMCVVVMSWCLAYEVLLRLGLVAACGDSAR